MVKIMPIFKKIDIFGSSVQLSFQHQTYHKTCCGGIFTILLIMIFGVAFWIQGQDVIFKTNPDIYYDSNSEQSPSFGLNMETFPIAFGLRKKRDLSYIQIDNNIGFEASIEIDNIDDENKQIIHSSLPIQFIECSNLLSGYIHSRQGEINLNQSSSWNTFIEYIQQKKNKANLYCIKFDKNNDNTSKYFLKSKINSRSLISFKINKCLSKNPSYCIDTQYNLSLLELEVIFINNTLSFSNRDNPLHQVVQSSFFSLSPNLEKIISLNFQHTEISTEDSLFFNEVTQENFGLICQEKEQDFQELDQDNKILMQVSFSMMPNSIHYRRHYRKLSSVIAEIGGLSKALMFIFGLIVTPFAKIEFQTALLNEIFCFEDDEDTENKKNEEEMIYFQDANSPGLPKLKSCSRNSQTNQIAQIQMTAQNKSIHNEIQTNIPQLFQNISTFDPYPEDKNAQNIQQQQQNTPSKQETILIQMKEKNDSSYLQQVFNRSSLKDTMNIDQPTETTTSIPKNRRSELGNIIGFDSPGKVQTNAFNIQINGVKGDNNLDSNQINLQNVENKDTDGQNQIFNKQQTQDQVNINNNETNDNNKNIKNIPNDMITSIKASEQSPIKKYSLSKKLKRGITADQNFISNILHEYQETLDPDSAKLRKRKSLRKQGDGFLKKIFTPRSGGLIFRAYEYIMFYIFPIGKIKKKKNQLEYTLDKISDRLDAVFIINKLIEIDKLKMLMLNENQLKLFDYMPKPVINNLTQQQQLQKIQDEQSVNSNTVKGLSLKLKSAATTHHHHDESKFKTTWSILDSEKTTLMKAHEAYTAFNIIKDERKDISIIDKKLLSMLDPKILSQFENTRQNLYNQKHTEATPLGGGDGLMNKGVSTFQIYSNQIINQENDLNKRTSLQRPSQLLEVIDNNNNNINNKTELNFTKCIGKLQNEQINDRFYSQQTPKKQTIKDESPEKRQMLLNESQDIAHESYSQNKTIFTEFNPTKNLNTSIC